MNDAVLTEEGRYRLLVESITDYAVYMLDPTGIVISWNAGAERFKGYAASEIIGQHFSRFYTEEERAAGIPAWALSRAETEGRFETEGWRVRKDGSRFWTHIIIDPIRSPAGKILGFAKVTRDLTERQEAQRALEETREALFQSQKLEAVGQLTGGVAHDFNNLLMVISSSLEMVKRRLPDGDLKLAGLIENAMRASDRGASLTQRMLAFARKQDLDPKPIDVVDLARGMNELLRGAVGPSIHIETRFPLALPPVLTDANQLESALLNLAVNARDAMPQGGCVIIAAELQTVNAGHKTKLPPGDYVCLCVKDSGEGMDEDTLQRAAEPFFTTKGVGKGTGLGLPMIQGLAEQSGGRLVLKSEKGGGTEAQIWLPIAEPESDEMKNEPGMIAPQTETPRSSVLAVDDDALVLMNTAAMLEDAGHEVIEASSANQALHILRNKPNVDLVITDHAMPGMTGAELAAAIAAEFPELPVIIATGYADIPGGLGNGLPKLSKPFLQGEIEAAVHDALAQKSKN